MVASADTQVEPRTLALSYYPRVDPKLSRRFEQKHDAILI